MASVKIDDAADGCRGRQEPGRIGAGRRVLLGGMARRVGEAITGLEVGGESNSVCALCLPLKTGECPAGMRVDNLKLFGYNTFCGNDHERHVR